MNRLTFLMNVLALIVLYVSLSDNLVVNGLSRGSPADLDDKDIHLRGAVATTASEVKEDAMKDALSINPFVRSSEMSTKEKAIFEKQYRRKLKKGPPKGFFAVRGPRATFVGGENFVAGVNRFPFANPFVDPFVGPGGIQPLIGPGGIQRFPFNRPFAPNVLTLGQCLRVCNGIASCNGFHRNRAGFVVGPAGGAIVNAGGVLGPAGTAALAGDAALMAGAGVLAEGVMYRDRKLTEDSDSNSDEGTPLTAAMAQDPRFGANTFNDETFQPPKEAYEAIKLADESDEAQIPLILEDKEQQLNVEQLVSDENADVSGTLEKMVDEEMRSSVRERHLRGTA